MASSKSVTINLNVEASMSRSFDASTIGGVKVEDDFASAFGVTMAKIDASAMTPQSAAGGDDSYSVHPKTPLLAPSTATTGGLKRKENFKTPNTTKTARRRPPVRAQGALAAAGVFATPAAAPTLKYASRKNSGKVETVMNNMITDAVARGDGTDAFIGAGSSQKVALVATPLAAAAAKAPKLEAGAVRFMHTTAAQKANFLERRVLAMGKRLRAAHKLPEFSPLGVPSQSTVVVCGRVCCECEPAAIGSGVAALEARLDAGSVMLEGSRALSSGARVSVDLSNLPAYSLFPGQIVAISGVDVTGARLVAQALYTGAAPPRAAAVAAAAAAAAGAAAPIRAEQKQPLRVWSAAGPFTTTDNLNFVPLHDFVTLAAEVRETPDVIVLSGPFIPASHPQLKAGACVLNHDGENVELSHFELFRLKVLDVIQDLLDEKPNMKVCACVCARACVEAALSSSSSPPASPHLLPSPPKPFYRSSSCLRSMMSSRTTSSPKHHSRTPKHRSRAKLSRWASKISRRAARRMQRDEFLSFPTPAHLRSAGCALLRSRMMWYVQSFNLPTFRKASSVLLPLFSLLLPLFSSPSSCNESMYMVM